MNRVWIVFAAVVISVWPQQPQFRTRSDIVEVYTTVTAKDGAKVTDLRGDEFELLEDGKPREIAVFSALVGATVLLATSTLPARIRTRMTGGR